MVNVNPWERLSATEYLHMSKGCRCVEFLGVQGLLDGLSVFLDVLFPKEMYSFLIKYCKLFANQPVLASDEKIARLVCRQTDGRTDRQMDRQMNRKMDKGTDKWTKEQTNRQT